MGPAARAVDLSVVFARPAALDGVDVWLDCEVVQAGPRWTVVASALWSGGRCCARAQVGFIGA
jgi:hypothetical protein